MIYSFINILNILLPILYLSVFSLYLTDFYKEEKLFKSAKRYLLIGTLLLHCLYLFFRTIEYDHTPITNKFEIFSIISCSIAFSYLALELATNIRGTGAFIIFFSFLFQLISSLLVPDTYSVPDVLRNRLLGIHVISAILGYSGITISAVYGVLYLILYKQIKSSRFGLFFERLPSLEILEKLSYYSTLIGFILLGMAIVIGIVWLPAAFPNFSYADPKLIGTIIVWVVYGITIITKYFNQWFGKKLIYFTLVGFTIAILSLIITNTFAKTFHAFY
jgi:HemX protein